MKEERFRSMFAAFGTVTDCTLKFTKDGKFRKFGFVGFKSEEDANTALKHFDKSFVDTSRVTVWLRDGVSVASASNLLIFQVNNAFTFICRWKCVSLLEIPLNQKHGANTLKDVAMTDPGLRRKR